MTSLYTTWRLLWCSHVLTVSVIVVIFYISITNKYIVLYLKMMGSHSSLLSIMLNKMDSNYVQLKKHRKYSVVDTFKIGIACYQISYWIYLIEISTKIWPEEKSRTFVLINSSLLPNIIEKGDVSMKYFFRLLITTACIN